MFDIMRRTVGVRSRATRTVPHVPLAPLAGVEPPSLFDCYPWLYAFCRERLFRDDTERIVDALWPSGGPDAGSRLLELGCGPGFYARNLAAGVAHLRVTGLDRSRRQLSRARLRTVADHLTNCRFTAGDVRALAWPAGAFDTVVAARLFTVLPEREQGLAEMHRVLRPGGRCFITEPRSALRAAAPLRAMWLLAGLSALLSGERRRPYLEPARVAILTHAEFDILLASQPWGRLERWQDRWYQYALCEKGPC